MVLSLSTEAAAQFNSFNKPIAAFATFADEDPVTPPVESATGSVVLTPWVPQGSFAYSFWALLPYTLDPRS